MWRSCGSGLCLSIGAQLRAEIPFFFGKELLMIVFSTLATNLFALEGQH